MARKLTDLERTTIEYVRDALVKALPADERSYAAGIASSLVRVRDEAITSEDLERILEKYDAGLIDARKKIEDAVLEPVEGNDGEFTLKEFEVAEDAAGEPVEQDEEGAQAQEAPEGSDAASEDAEAAGSASADAADEGQAEADEAPSADEQPQDSGTEPAGEDSPKQEAPASEEKAPASRTRHRARRTHKTVTRASKDAEETKDSEESSESKEPAEPKESKGSKDSKEPAKPRGRKKQAEAAARDKQPDQKQSADKPKDKDSQPAGKASKDKAPAQKKRGDKPQHEVQGRHEKPHHDLRKIPYVRRGGDSEAELRSKILALNPRFWINGWLLSHPSAYTLYEDQLKAINEALSDNDMLPGDITRRQLAYKMGGDEKFFEYGSDGFRLLRAMGMEDIVRHRPLPQADLTYYAPRRRKHMRVLVTENLDPYLDVHDLMYEDGKTSILGERIHAVVLGAGNPVLEHNRLALLLDTLHAETVEVLYWGDIDRAGVDIMVRLKDVLGDGYKFKAFKPAYELMIQKAMERYPDPADNETTGQVNIDLPDTSLLTEGLTQEEADYAQAVIEDCGLIPQEILTKRDL